MPKPMFLDELESIMLAVSQNGYEDEIADGELRYIVGMTTRKVSNNSIGSYVEALDRFKFIRPKRVGLLWYILRSTIGDAPRDPDAERAQAIARATSPVTQNTTQNTEHTTL